MHLIELSDAASFLTRSQKLLMESEAQNNLILSSSLSLARASMARSPRLSFFVVEVSGKAVCAGLNSSERRLLISTASAEAAGFMGGEIAARGLPLKGVLGPGDAVAHFSDSYSAGGGRQLTPKIPQNVLRLEGNSAQKFNQGPGLARIAKEKDLRLLLKWTRQFVEECEIDESASESEEVLRRYLEGRQLYIWEDSKPVAMAGFGGVTPNGVRVNMVYTDPGARSRGYAGSLVNVLSRKLLADGHRSCFLYVEKANAAANRVYEKIGYKTIGDFIEYR